MSYLLKIVKAIAGIVVVYVVVVVLSYMATYGRSTYQPTVNYVLEEGWGFEAGKAYPLRLGAPVDGSAGSLAGQASFFLIGGGAQLNGRVEPMTSVRMEIDNAGISYILVIPVDHVKFHQQTGPATAAFTTDDAAEKQIPFFDGSVVKRTGSAWTLNERHVFEFPNISTAREWSGIQNKGLGAYLQAHITVVDLTLTPAQFNAYLGATN